MASLIVVLIVSVCIVPKVAESSCRDKCSCQDDQCAACNATGYNGSVCERSCSVGCLDGLCGAHTGVCSRKECKENFVGKDCSLCKPGKFGQNCLQDCSPHCAVCSSNGSCRICELGYFGNKCERRSCPEGCLGDLCEENRKCYKCKPNFVGEFCEDCINGTHCKENCSPNCISCWSYNNCTECKSGYHGESCQLKCSHGCLNDKCNQRNGTCYYRCKAEFKGDFCQECVKGRYGTNCSGNCSSYCKGKVCEQTTGHCLNGCNLEMYGPTCEYKCPRNCETCSSDILCHTCSTGLWGDGCNLMCSEGCLGSCFQNGTCRNCKEGYYGSFCNLPCPAHSSDLRCTTGLSGNRCKHNCSLHCCNGTCNRDGACEACASGFDSESQSYDVEKIGWISVTCLFAVITFLLVAYNILLQRRLAKKLSIISNIHRGIENSDINTADLEIATLLPLSEGMISSYQNFQSAVYELPRNTTASNMQNGEEIRDDISAHVYSGPYEQPIKLRERNTYIEQHTNDTQTAGSYEKFAAAASGACGRDVRWYEELTPGRYEELTPRRWTQNYCDIQDL